MDWHLTSTTILVVGATLVALLALGNRIVLVRAIHGERQRVDYLNNELGKVRKSADDRQAHDSDTITRLTNRTQQQGQMLRALQEDLDKFITQHRAMLDMKNQQAGAPPTAAAQEQQQQETDAVEQREKAIREKLRSMLQEFRAVTGGDETGQSARAA